MNHPVVPDGLQDLRRDVARLRRLVGLLVLPWVVVGLTSLSTSPPDVIEARRFVVVDEQGQVRAELGAPVLEVRRTFHGKEEPQPVPSLRMNFHDGSTILVGGGGGDFDPQVRVDRGEWWTGIRASGLFIVNESEKVSAHTVLSAQRLELGVDREGSEYRAIDMVAFDGEGRASITITNGDTEAVIPAP